jgi:hypothetical protein
MRALDDKLIFKLIEFSMTKKISKFNNSHTIGLKIMKPPPFSHTHQGLYNGGKSTHPIFFTKIFFDF